MWWRSGLKIAIEQAVMYADGDRLRNAVSRVRSLSTKLYLEDTRLSRDNFPYSLAPQTPDAREIAYAVVLLEYGRICEL